MKNLFTDFGFQKIEFDESKKRQGVLGTAKGNFFFSRVASRNKRIYPDETWETVLRNDKTVNLLDNGLMLGTVGHADMDADTMIREGYVSHRTVKLELNTSTGIGYGEAEILDTPVGRILHTLVKSGSRMAVSSKATGDYNGRDDNDNDVVDSATFDLERFDFVADPGFLNARPKLREAFNEALNIKKNVVEDNSQTINKEELKMEAIVERVLAEKMELEKQIEALTEQLKERDSKISDLQKLISATEGKDGELQEATKKVEELTKFFETNGTADEIIEKLKSADGIAEKIKDLGDLEEVANTLKDHSAMVEALSEIGTVEEIKESMEKAEAFVLEVAELGTIEEIKEALDTAEAYINHALEADTTEKAEALAATYGVEVETVKDLMEKFEDSDKVDELLKGLKASGTTKRDLKENKGTKIEDTITTILDKSRSTRMFEGYGQRG